jgi:hypothetical protein
MEAHIRPNFFTTTHATHGLILSKSVNTLCLYHRRNKTSNERRPVTCRNVCSFRMCTKDSRHVVLIEFHNLLLEESILNNVIKICGMLLESVLLVIWLHELAHIGM